MPTRNRARLLRLALQSALELRGDDYEVVVSDNCSSDETREIVEAPGDSRIRYVRTPRPLAASENMEFVLGCARGDHVTFLNDDDALTAGALESVRPILDATRAQLVVWPYCQYFYPDWYDVRYRNTLVAQPRSGRVTEVHAHETLAALYRTFDQRRTPTAANAVCHRALIDRAHRRVPRLFPLVSGDIFAGVVLLVEAVTYWSVDLPLTILGRWAGSLGSSRGSGRGRARLAYAREFPEDVTPRSVPLRAATPINMMAEALLRAKTAVGADLPGIELDWARYFVRCFADLTYQHVQGADVRDDLREFDAVLACQPPAVRDAATSAIRAAHHGYQHAWRRAARRLVNRVPLLGWVESLARPALTVEGGGVALRGAEAGFHDILEGARVWDRVLSAHPVALDIPRVGHTA